MPGPGELVRGLTRWAPNPEVAQIDWTHPLAWGLEIAIVNGFDMVSKRWCTRNGNMTTTSTRWGAGADMGTTGYWEFAAPDAPFISGGASYFWFGNYRGGSGGGSSYAQFIGKHAGGGSTANVIDFRSNVSGTGIDIVRSNTSDSGFGSGGLGAGVSMVSASFVDEQRITGPLVVVNGIAVSGGSAGSGGAVTGSSAPFRIGRRADDFCQLDGAVSAVLMYSRFVRAPECMSLYSDPYQMLRW